MIFKHQVTIKFTKKVFLDFTCSTKLCRIIRTIFAHKISKKRPANHILIHIVVIIVIVVVIVVVIVIIVVVIVVDVDCVG